MSSHDIIVRVDGKCEVNFLWYGSLPSETGDERGGFGNTGAFLPLCLGTTLPVWRRGQSTNYYHDYVVWYMDY